MRIFSFFTFGFSFLALAGLTACDVQRDSGLWRGTVKVREEGRTVRECDVELNLTHTNETMTIHHLHTGCDAYGARWEGESFEVHERSLFLRGREVGWVTLDGTAELALQRYDLGESYPLLADELRLSWQRKGEGLGFTEEVTYAGRKRYSTGTLWRVQ